MRSRAEYQRVLQLIRSGWRDCDIERRTGVPARTINQWRAGKRRGGTRPRPPKIASRARWRPIDEGSYAYLLGLYLGDGHVAVRSADSSYIRLFLDSRYGAILEEASKAMSVVAEGARVTRRRRAKEALTIVQCSWQGWPLAFPQHGAGRKLERRIVLEPWQAGLVDRHPDRLVRGLVHSDGCRTTNRFHTRLPSGRLAEYEYVRYFFSNHSEDILGIFTQACGSLGVCCTRSNHRNISVSQRTSVALLDSFVGPKR